MRDQLIRLRLEIKQTKLEWRYRWTPEERTALKLLMLTAAVCVLGLFILGTALGAALWR